MNPLRVITSDVTLVCMPFGALFMPALGPSLLKSALTQAGVSSRICYFNLRFAERIGERLYAKICDQTNTHDLVGEWIFSNALFHHQSEREVEQFTDDILRCKALRDDSRYEYLKPMGEKFIQNIMAARDRVEAFLDECLEELISCQPKIVGFSSVFQQNVACLALARRLRERLPGVFIVFGGANCEGVMGEELIRQFEFVDAAVSGEADLIFPELTHRVLRGQTIDDLPGVHCRAGSGLPVLQQATKSSAQVKNLDELPIPDYDDYFDQLGRQSQALTKPPLLLFETSRGCWWGEKLHCTFCGLNGENMVYRSKTASRAFEELTNLTDRYPGYSVNAVDNILSMGYFKDFLPLLAERKLGFNLFYEVKANLRKDQVRLLQQAGVTEIQPGIESLSDEILQLMRKGVKALQNIQLLKWCKEFGINPCWNLIWGFPGESAKEYEQMAELLPLLTHLQPPLGAGKIRVDRFSPNFNDAERLGFKNLKPFPAYEYIYPLPQQALMNLAYHFTHDYIEPQQKLPTPILLEEINKWHVCHKQSQMFWIEKEGLLLLWDMRPVALDRLTVLTGLKKLVYLACDQVSAVKQITELCQSQHTAAVSEAEIRDILNDLTAKKLMLRQGNAYLSLAVASSLPDR
ncbi:MAG: RiPP maturation radical SAM C-methyltransferase [Blastocatellia bacterium]